MYTVKGPFFLQKTLPIPAQPILKRQAASNVVQKWWHLKLSHGDQLIQRGFVAVNGVLTKGRSTKLVEGRLQRRLPLHFVGDALLKDTLDGLHLLPSCWRTHPLGSNGHPMFWNPLGLEVVLARPACPWTCQAAQTILADLEGRAALFWAGRFATGALPLGFALLLLALALGTRLRGVVLPLSCLAISPVFWLPSSFSVFSFCCFFSFFLDLGALISWPFSFVSAASPSSSSTCFPLRFPRPRPRPRPRFWPRPRPVSGSSWWSSVPSCSRRVTVGASSKGVCL